MIDKCITFKLSCVAPTRSSRLHPKLSHGAQILIIWLQHATTMTANAEKRGS